MTTKTPREHGLIDTRQLHAIYALIVPIVLFLLILFIGLSSAGCARSAAQQPAEPPPPKVSAAAVVARDVTESGNTSAASIPLAFSKLVEQGAVTAGDPVLLFGFGGNLSYAGQVVRCP